jgi:Tfp pilus assembly protein PilX
MTRHATLRSDERGIALVVALFMVLILSVIASSLMFVSRTETMSSLNYKTMSQARYGAESGVHDAVNHLLWTYTPPGGVAEPIAGVYDTTKSPVQYNGAPVVLSSDGAYLPNYPVATVQTAFSAATQGLLSVNVGSVAYSARATLLTMQVIPDPFIPGQSITLQRWNVTGSSQINGAGSAQVEVSAIIEKPPVPVYRYAAFATDSGCDALKFGGGATTDSYDSSTYGGSGVPAVSLTGSNVGTNGNLTEIGSTTTINGTLSTPRTGVGNCSGGNVSALTASGGATVTGGLVALPQTVTFPTPPAPNPMPLASDMSFNNGCPSGTAAFCSVDAAGVHIDPSLNGGTVILNDMKVAGGTNVLLKPGIYIVNSISFSGNSTMTLDTTGGSTSPVIFNVAGASTNTPIDFTGGTISNTTYDPTRFQILYAGDKSIKLSGGSASSALVYAPNASGSFTGGAGFYGAVVAGKITDMGGATIHYDRNLDKKALMAGPPTMSEFTWKTF